MNDTHPPQPPRRRVYSIPQTAAELDVSERTVWRLIAAQKIKTIKISLGRTHITSEEIERVATQGIAR